MTTTLRLVNAGERQASSVPRCCEWNGLNYADGRRCWRHATQVDHELVANLDRQAQAVGITADTWPYGPNIDVPARQALVAWARGHRLRLVNRPRPPGVRWLSRGADGHRHPDWMDHVTYWKRDGKPALLLAQPYGCGLSDIADLATHTDLKVRFSGLGWYGHGTVAVEVWRRDIHDNWTCPPHRAASTSDHGSHEGTTA